MTDVKKKMHDHKIFAAQKNFAQTLELIQDKPEKLLELASGIIKCSHSHRGLKERKLPDSSTALTIPVHAARWNIEHDRLISTDDMLKMIMQKYDENGYGSPDIFKKDFCAAYPDEYHGQTAAPKNMATGKVMATYRQSTYS